MKLYAAALAFFITGCGPLFSSDADTNLPPPEPIVTSLELTLARGSLFKSEFEQYGLKDNALFFECGEYRRGHNTPLAQDVQEVPLEDRASLNEVIEKLLRLQGRGMTAPEPGAGSGFTDPGRFELKLATKETSFAIATSLDWVTSSQTAAAQALLTLAAHVRGWTNQAVACENMTFYGIGNATQPLWKPPDT